MSNDDGERAKEKLPVEKSLSVVCLVQAVIAVPAVVVFFGSGLASFVGGFPGSENLCLWSFVLLVQSFSVGVIAEAIAELIRLARSDKGGV